MPKDYFAANNTKSLADLSPSARIHVIGVCGVAMAQLAVELTSRGFDVSGSDKAFYEPMGSLLRNSKVKLCEGYRRENVPDDAELVVIGNVVSYGHPEVDVVEERKLPYTFFSKLLYELLIAGRHSIVCAGTHGKSTTSAMTAAALRAVAKDPSYFVGGSIRGFEQSLYVGSDSFSVVEGDEYDSAFFAKQPKFDFYKPDTLVVTAVEFDHADIYDSLEKINQEFIDLILSMPADGCLIANADTENVRSIIEFVRPKWGGSIFTYGALDCNDYVLTGREVTSAGQTISLSSPQQTIYSYQIKLPGRINALNSIAVFLVMLRLGFDAKQIAAALSVFEGVKRRQELRVDTARVKLIEDFAHHPTAVAEMIEVLREQYPDRKLWAVFEPRSNTSRLKVFFDKYLQAFSAADQVILARVAERSGDSKDLLMNVDDLGDALSKLGTATQVFSESEEIADFLEQNLGDNDAVLVMSNGSFGGLIDRLCRLWT